MVKRMGALLWLSVACTLATVQSARAQGPYTGATSFQGHSSDAQSSFPASQQQTRICYKLVWEEVKEQRWHTCYKPVQTTVTNTVCKTVMEKQCRTMEKAVPCKVIENVQVEKMCPVRKCIMVDQTYTVCKPVYEHCVRDVCCTVCKKVPETCYKECCHVVCKPVYNQHVTVACHQVQKQIMEQHIRECKVVCCKPVCETTMKTVCCQVCKNVMETHTRACCTTVRKTVMKTCYKDCVQHICEPVTKMKCETRRCKELCCETYCKPGRCVTCWETRCECCFDPCTCKTSQRSRLVRVTHQLPPETCTRQVWKWKCETVQVPCTTYVKKCVHNRVPYQVCEQVCENVVQQVPYTTCRAVQGAYIDDKGGTFECDGPGRTFKPCAVVHKQIPCTVTRMVTTCETKREPYTTCKVCCGAYMDDKGQGHDCDGPGRNFVCGGQIKTQQVHCTKRMVQETVRTQVPYTVMKDVVETQVRKQPYTKCTMVQQTLTRKCPQTICEMQKVTETQQVCKTIMKMQTYTVECCVPKQVIENVPCTVTKWVKHCEPYFENVKRCKTVPYVVACPAPVACPQPCVTHCPQCQTISSGPACNACGPVACGNNCHACPTTCSTGCCENSCCLLARFRRWFSSANCCDPCQTCQTCTSCKMACPPVQTCCPAPACRQDCCDPCQEGLLQRLFRNRFCCTNCCDSCTPCSTPCTSCK